MSSVFQFVKRRIFAPRRPAVQSPRPLAVQQSSPEMSLQEKEKLHKKIAEINQKIDLLQQQYAVYRDMRFRIRKDLEIANSNPSVGFLWFVIHVILVLACIRTMEIDFVMEFSIQKEHLTRLIRANFDEYYKLMAEKGELEAKLYG